MGSIDDREGIGQGDVVAVKKQKKTTVETMTICSGQYRATGSIPQHQKQDHCQSITFLL